MASACTRPRRPRRGPTRRRRTPTTTSARATRSSSSPRRARAAGPTRRRRSRRPSSSTRTTARPTASSAKVLIHADDEAGAIQNWTKALETKPDQTQYYVASPTNTTALMFFDQAEQVLREGLSFAKEDDKHLFNLHALLGSLYENKGDFSARGHRVRSGEEVVRQQQVQRPQRGVFQPRHGVRGAEPAARRTRPSSSCSRSGRSPARARSRPSTPTSAPVAGDRAPDGRHRCSSRRCAARRPGCRARRPRVRRDHFRRAREPRARTWSERICRSRFRMPVGGIVVGRERREGRPLEAALWYRLLCAVHVHAELSRAGHAIRECDLRTTGSAVPSP